MWIVKILTYGISIFPKNNNFYTYMFLKKEVQSLHIINFLTQESFKPDIYEHLKQQR